VASITVVVVPRVSGATSTELQNLLEMRRSELVAQQAVRGVAVVNVGRNAEEEEEEKEEEKGGGGDGGGRW